MIKLCQIGSKKFPLETNKNFNMSLNYVTEQIFGKGAQGFCEYMTKIPNNSYR